MLCKICKEDKATQDFSPEKSRGKVHYKRTCKACWNTLPSTKNYKRRSTLLVKYRLTIAAYDELRKRQDYRCAICGLHEDDNLFGKLYVDHDHNTNIVRGLLCSECNSGVGKFRDNPALMKRAAAYVEQQ